MRNPGLKDETPLGFARPEVHLVLGRTKLCFMPAFCFLPALEGLNVNLFHNFYVLVNPTNESCQPVRTAGVKNIGLCLYRSRCFVLHRRRVLQ